jgi:hypothetical protein
VKELRLVAQFRPSSEPTVGRMCQIEPDLADFPLTKSIGSFNIELRFPRVIYPLPSIGYYNASAGDEESKPAALYPAYFTAATIVRLPDNYNDASLEASLKPAVDAMRSAATRLSDSIRLAQPSVGLAGECPEMLSISATDVATSQEVGVPIPLKPGYGLVTGYPALTIGVAKEVLETGPSPTRSLLAQASYLSWSTADPQPGLAILLAAVACEAHAKEILLQRVDPVTRPLLDTLLRRPRIFQEPAVELFGEVAKVILGTSLKEENRDLWKDLVNLFELRNKMAHVADRPSIDRVKELTVAARQAMDWLDAKCAKSLENNRREVPLRTVWIAFHCRAISRSNSDVDSEVSEYCHRQ